jgi:hypothetical protein
MAAVKKGMLSTVTKTKGMFGSKVSAMMWPDAFLTAYTGILFLSCKVSAPDYTGTSFTNKPPSSFRVGSTVHARHMHLLTRVGV